MSGTSNISPLRTLGDALQPVHFYDRERSGYHDFFSPLNRFADAVPPESDTARRFLLLVNTLVAGHPTESDWEAAKRQLILWRDNDKRLQPILSGSSLTQELIPVSSTLREVAEVGLTALDYLERGRVAPAEWRSHELVFLAGATQPKADLLNLAVPPVKELVEATAR
jgi:hexosaminidase